MINYLEQIDRLIENDFKIEEGDYLEKLSDLIQNFEQTDQKVYYNQFLFNKENEKSSAAVGNLPLSTAEA
jgi:hypothetical protein